MHTGGRPARKNRRPRNAAGQAIPAGASREGLSRRTTRAYKGQGAARGSTCRGGWLLDAAWSLIERAHGVGREPTPGFWLCGRTEAARRVPRGRSEPAPGAGFYLPAVLPAAAGRSRRSGGARRELTRARSGDRQVSSSTEPLWRFDPKRITIF